MKNIFTEFFCFRNFYSSISLFVACLAGSNDCEIVLSGFFTNSSNHCHNILSIRSEWLLLWTLNTKMKLIFSAKSHSLKAAIFHTMAFKVSRKINQNKISHSTRRSFLKVLNIPFEQYYRFHVGSQIAIC